MGVGVGGRTWVGVNVMVRSDKCGDAVTLLWIKCSIIYAVMVIFCVSVMQWLPDTQPRNTPLHAACLHCFFGHIIITCIILSEALAFAPKCGCIGVVTGNSRFAETSRMLQRCHRVGRWSPMTCFSLPWMRNRQWRNSNSVYSFGFDCVMLTNVGSCNKVTHEH